MKKLIKLKISLTNFTHLHLKLKSNENSPSCDVHLTGSVDILLRLLRSEESIVDHEVVHLRYFLRQRIMFPQESQQLLARSIDRQLLRQQILILQHVLEENLSEAASLSRLVNIKVQDTWCVYVTGLSVFVEDVERFAADFKETNDEAAREKGERWKREVSDLKKSTILRLKNMTLQ